MSNKRIPNLSVTDGFDFVKKIWGSLPIPSVMNPTTDLDELDKRISDLKAVEQWLNVNLSMLRATIQGLEVQRGTIATIKSFGSNLGLGGDRANEVNQAVNEEIIRNAMQAAVAPPLPRVEPVIPKTPEPESPATGDTASGAGDSSSAIVSNATAWWGLLQDQFNKVVATAAAAGASSQAQSDSASAPKSKTPARKPRETAKAAAKPKAGQAGTSARKSASSPRSTRTRT